ncbi:MAG TPA: hypothetical protein VE913_24740 [Longimicrobium sp.]|nr:hypothetical protein [Longimicrobium sp.]
MAARLDISDLEVTSFQTTSTQVATAMAPPAESWPAMCTCIGICQPTEDIACGGGGGPLQPAAA